MEVRVLFGGLRKVPLAFDAIGLRGARSRLARVLRGLEEVRLGQRVLADELGGRGEVSRRLPVLVRAKADLVLELRMVAKKRREVGPG